jgi:hypothetical protein
LHGLLQLLIISTQQLHTLHGYLHEPSLNNIADTKASPLMAERKPAITFDDILTRTP